MRNKEKGAIGWILLWLIGIPIPILVILFWCVVAHDAIYTRGTRPMTSLISGIGRRRPFWAAGRSYPETRVTLEVLLVKSQDAMPHILRRCGAIARPIVREESVAGVTIHPKLIDFPVPVEFFLQAGSMRR